MASSNHIAHTLLSKAHPPEIASAIFTEKVLHKPLHLRPTSPDPSSQDARAKRRLQRLRKNEKSHRRQKPKRLSAKEKRISGIYEIPKDAQKHEIYVPLHRIWLGYMWEILGLKDGEAAYVTAHSAGSKLASADFHGAEIVVVRSTCVGMVGSKGIVIRDTKFTFQIITDKNELKSKLHYIYCHIGFLTSKLAIPKRHTIFRFEIPQPEVQAYNPGNTAKGKQTGQDSLIPQSLIFELHGSQFENRATDRATKKFKQRNMTDI